MKPNRSTLVLAINGGLWVITLGILYSRLAPHQAGSLASDPRAQRRYASVLAARGLYREAAAAYEQYARSLALGSREWANAVYLRSNILMDNLNDYSRALAGYLKIKEFAPKSPLLPQVNKRMVSCLEYLDRPFEARRALESTVSGKPDTVQSGQTIVAEIGGRAITLGEIEKKIRELPAGLASPFSSKEGKRKFLRQYVVTELLSKSAERRGLNNDPDVLRRTAEAKKSFMVEKLLEQEIASRIKVDNNDIKLYYQAHKDRYQETDKRGKRRQLSLAEAWDRGRYDYVAEKQKGEYERLIRKMLDAEDVKIYDDRIH